MGRSARQPAEQSHWLGIDTGTAPPRPPHTPKPRKQPHPRGTIKLDQRTRWFATLQRRVEINHLKTFDRHAAQSKAANTTAQAHHQTGRETFRALVPMAARVSPRSSTAHTTASSGAAQPFPIRTPPPKSTSSRGGRSRSRRATPRTPTHTGQLGQRQQLAFAGAFSKKGRACLSPR